MTKEKCKSQEKKKKEEEKKKERKKMENKNQRVVGGKETKYPMPWMVLIDIASSQCGGSIINSQFVLTAAHCFCAGPNACTRSMHRMDFADEPVKIKVKN